MQMAVGVGTEPNAPMLITQKLVLKAWPRGLPEAQARAPVCAAGGFWRLFLIQPHGSGCSGRDPAELRRVWGGEGRVMCSNFNWGCSKRAGSHPHRDVTWM